MPPEILSLIGSIMLLPHAAKEMQGKKKLNSDAMKKCICECVHCVGVPFCLFSEIICYDFLLFPKELIALQLLFLRTVMSNYEIIASIQLCGIVKKNNSNKRI